MATDIVLLSTRRAIGEIVVVTGDSDFLPAIRIARDEGVLVRLAHGVGRDTPHRELWQTADEQLELNCDFLSRCLLPLTRSD